MSSLHCFFFRQPFEPSEPREELVGDLEADGDSGHGEGDKVAVGGVGQLEGVVNGDLLVRVLDQLMDGQYQIYLKKIKVISINSLSNHRFSVRTKFWEDLV